QSPEKKSSQHCWRRERSTAGKHAHTKEKAYGTDGANAVRRYSSGRFDDLGARTPGFDDACRPWRGSHQGGETGTRRFLSWGHLHVRTTAKVPRRTQSDV